MASFACILAKAVILSINMRNIDNFAMFRLSYIHKAMMANMYKTGRSK